MGVSALSAGAYTVTLYVMVNMVGVHPPSSAAWANFSINDGMYARKRALPLYVFSVVKSLYKFKATSGIKMNKAVELIIRRAFIANS